MGYIYLLTFSNGKFYVGQTRRSITCRFRQHRADAKIKCQPLYQAWRKYGEPALLVLAEAPHADLDRLEVSAIAAVGSIDPIGYNLTPGGDFNPSNVPAIVCSIV